MNKYSTIRTLRGYNSEDVDTAGMSAEGNVSMLLGDPRKAIRTMTVPLLIALLVIQVNALADRAWCSGLGTDALAATAPFRMKTGVPAIIQIM